MRNALLLSFTALLLASCKPLIDQGGIKPQQVPDAMPQGYAFYEDGVIGAGDMVVLFFYAASDAASLRKDEELRVLYAEAEVPLATYRITIGDEPALEERFGVTKADTFVLIDESGETVKREEGASFTAVKRLLYGNVGTAKPGGASSAGAMMEKPDDDDAVVLVRNRTILEPCDKIRAGNLQFNLSEYFLP